MIWKVVHTKDHIETVYLVNAESSRQARGAVLDALYERTVFVDPPYTVEELAGDTFGLKAHTARYGVDKTDAALCREHGCSINAAPWDAEIPYRLYALNTETGEMR